MIQMQEGATFHCIFYLMANEHNYLLLLAKAALQRRGKQIHSPSNGRAAGPGDKPQTNLSFVCSCFY